MKIPRVCRDSQAQRFLLTNSRRLMTAISLGLAFTTALLISSVGNSASQLAPNYEILHSFTGNDNHGFTGDTDGANPRDSTDTIVWYEQYFTYEDGSYDFHYYYDQKGNYGLYSQLRGMQMAPGRNTGSILMGSESGKPARRKG